MDKQGLNSPVKEIANYANDHEKQIKLLEKQVDVLIELLNRQIKHGNGITEQCKICQMYFIYYINMPNPLDYRQCITCDKFVCYKCCNEHEIEDDESGFIECNDCCKSE